MKGMAQKSGSQNRLTCPSYYDMSGRFFAEFFASRLTLGHLVSCSLNFFVDADRLEMESRTSRTGAMEFIALRKDERPNQSGSCYQDIFDAILKQAG